jgi:hypothetical protein
MFRVEGMATFCGNRARSSAILEAGSRWGTKVEDSAYHVLLAGRKVGPYDRRTIVGMRIKKALTSDHVLIARDGAQMTVADLIRKPAPENFNANRSSVFSLVQATYTAALVSVGRGALDIPRFKGETEARVQSDVLRIAGRFRRGFRWKDGRIKIPLNDIMHARINGSQAELWIRAPASTNLQHVVLELFAPSAAGDFVEWLPSATAYPGPVAAPANNAGAASSLHGLWIAIGSVALVVGVMLAVLLWPRFH